MLCLLNNFLLCFHYLSFFLSLLFIISVLVEHLALEVNQIPLASSDEETNQLVIDTVVHLNIIKTGIIISDIRIIIMNAAIIVMMMLNSDINTIWISSDVVFIFVKFS